MTIEEYFGDWIKVIDKVEANNVMKRIVKESKIKTILPSVSNIFKAFQLCPYNDLRVVFVGQDPYPQKGVATGILFGNRSDTKEEDLSPSLKVIKECAINFEIPHNSVIFDPTLESWARQGILMINSALTVELGKVGSHVMLWRPFISSLLKNLSVCNTGIVYVLFGSQAQTFKPYIGKFNTIMCIEHPAYFARMGKKMPHEVFTNISKIVKEIYGVPIEWYKEY